MPLFARRPLSALLASGLLAMAAGSAVVTSAPGAFPGSGAAAEPATSPPGTPGSPRAGAPFARAGEAGPPELPLAWNASAAPLPVLARDGFGAMVPTGEVLPPGAARPVSDERVSDGHATFRPLRARPDRYLAEASVALALPADALPPGVAPGEPWLDLGPSGTLTTFEGRRPLRAELLPPARARALRACAGVAVLRPASPCLRALPAFASL